ncbi:unnamed protein product [Penicillium manginii]
MLLVKRQLLVTIPCLLLVLGFFLYIRPRPRSTVQPTRTPLTQPQSQHSFDGAWRYERDRDNLLLTQGQCDLAFPDLFADLERAGAARADRPITLGEIDSVPPRNGYIRAMIYDQQLYVIAKEGAVWSREIATLSAINRAILTSPEPLPNIEFAFNTDDHIDNAAQWGYTRRPEDELVWLVPDFGFWSWPEIKAGSIKEILMDVEDAEKEGMTWSKKNDKLLWRGTLSLGHEIRNKLISVTQKKPWADVKSLDQDGQQTMQDEYRTMPEFCDYKYLAQTEENTNSGHLKYLQMCRSVIVSHKLDWIQHHSHLLRSSGSQQNFVEVDRDWSNLEKRMKWLRKHDKDAQRIADNSVETFRERYLTQAAEVCYWRRLIQEWAKASDFEPEFFTEENGKKVQRGLSAETFLLMRAMDWES